MPVMFRGNMQFTGWRKPISISGAGKAVGVILRRRPCFLPGNDRRNLASGARPCGLPTRKSASLSEAIAVAVRFDLLDFPEHPDKGDPEANDDAEEQ